MDVVKSLSQSDLHAISCIEMHTTGEPVRIIYRGYPELSGTLMEQRREAKLHHDFIRQRLMLEPRGHSEMLVIIPLRYAIYLSSQIHKPACDFLIPCSLPLRYGAIIRPITEQVVAGKAHIGVLFCHGEGYSTMCGHATIALGRFLVDTHDLSVFPRRDLLMFDPESWTTKLLLHAPCGVVEVTIPVLGPGGKSDPSRPVSFLSVPSFAAALNLAVSIPASHHWPELGDRSTVSADISYGGAFYALISTSELGFASGLRPQISAIDIDALSRATALLKDVIMATPELKRKVIHPEHGDLSYLYSVMIVDEGLGVQVQGTKGVETGLCFFADQQIDRSPTGSCVAARMATAYARRILRKGDAWTYHSVVSNAFEGEGGFVGRVEAVVPVSPEREGVVVRTEGKAWYTGASTFTVEKGDKLGDLGFNLRELVSGKR